MSKNWSIEYFFSEENGKSIRINRDLLLNIYKWLCGRFSSFAAKKIEEIIEEEKEYYELNYSVFIDILNELKSKADLIYEYSKKIIEDRDDYFNLYCKAFEQACVDYQKDNLFQKENISEDDMLKNLKCLINLFEREKDYYHIKDLSNAREDILKNLKYIWNDSEIESFLVKYDEAVSKYDITKLEELLATCQSSILAHWKTFTTNVKDFKPGEPFKFLCHSTFSTVFEGGFNSNFVSTSLLTEEFTDTFRQGFGFILEPKNIVAAKSSDMNLFNGAKSTDDLLFYSSIMKIDVPERIIEECRERKEENKKNDSDKRVYSEIGINGFEPVAIFCITDGSKTLNSNYNNARELKQNFPHLEIIEIDLTMYKTQEELYDVRRNLQYTLEFKLGNYEFSGNERTVNDYSLFWRLYLKLKKNKDFTEQDIIELYKRNRELLSIFFDFNKLFTDYDEEEIKTVLYYNYKLRIIDVLSGDFKLWRLDEIFKVLSKYQYNDKLDKYVPGISNFLKLYNNIKLTDETIEKICSCKSFIEINKILISQIEMNNQIEEEKRKRELEEKKGKIANTISEAFSNSIKYRNFSYLYYTLSYIKEESTLPMDNLDMMNFLKLYPNVELDSNSIDLLCSLKEFDIEKINRVLVSRLKLKKLDLQSQAILLRSTISSFELEISFKEEEVEKVLEAQKIVGYEALYSLARMDIENLERSLEKENDYLHSLESSLQIELANSNALQESNLKLGKHEILNYFRLKSIREKISKNIQKIETIINSKNECLNRISSLQKSILNLKEQFKTCTNIAYDEFETTLETSKYIIYSMPSIEMLQFEIDNIKNRMSDKKKKITELERLFGEAQKLEEDVKHI